jgi:hypothetical protein
VLYKTTLTAATALTLVRRHLTLHFFINIKTNQLRPIHERTSRRLVRGPISPLLLRQQLTPILFVPSMQSRWETKEMNATVILQLIYTVSRTNFHCHWCLFFFFYNSGPIISAPNSSNNWTTGWSSPCICLAHHKADSPFAVVSLTLAPFWISSLTTSA